MRRLALVAALASLASPAAALAADRDVAIWFSSFQPADAIALTGDRVVWTNADPISHNVTASGNAFLSSPPLLTPGSTHAAPFPSEGRFPYRCTLHGGMSGTVSVYELYLAGPESPVRHGRSARLTGLAPSSSSVMIHRTSNGAVVATVHASASGAFSASFRGVPGQYFAMAAGRTSSPVRVAVTPRVNVSARRSRGRVNVTIGSTPAQPGGRVVVERARRGGGWTRMASGQLSSRSQATFRLALAPGTRIRARLVRPVGGYSPATSAALRVR